MEKNPESVDTGSDCCPFQTLDSLQRASAYTVDFRNRTGSSVVHPVEAIGNYKGTERLQQLEVSVVSTDREHLGMRMCCSCCLKASFAVSIAEG